jgi:hypothetical protein
MWEIKQRDDETAEIWFNGEVVGTITHQGSQDFLGGVKRREFVVHGITKTDPTTGAMTFYSSIGAGGAKEVQS